MTPRIIQRLVREDEYAMFFALNELLFRAHIEKIWGWHEAWQKDKFQKVESAVKRTCFWQETKPRVMFKCFTQPIFFTSKASD